MWLTQFLSFIVDSTIQESVIPVDNQGCMREWYGHASRLPGGI